MKPKRLVPPPPIPEREKCEHPIHILTLLSESPAYDGQYQFWCQWHGLTKRKTKYDPAPA